MKPRKDDPLVLQVPTSRFGLGTGHSDYGISIKWNLLISAINTLVNI
jgi:hypothetical protein